MLLARKSHFPVFRPVNSEHSVLQRCRSSTNHKWLKRKVLLDFIIYEPRQLTRFVTISREVVQSGRRAGCLSNRGICPFEAVLVDLQRLIFDSRVVPVTPSLAAAPDGRD